MISAVFIMSLLLVSKPLPMQAHTIEQTLGGITVGSNNILEVADKYGHLQKAESSEVLTVLRVTIRSSCRLTFVQENKRRIVTTATLAALGDTTNVGSKCLNIQTGSGLRIGSTLATVKKLYGKPQVEIREPSGVILVYDDQDDRCNGKPGDSLIDVHNMMIWLTPNALVQKISVSAERPTCAHLQDTVVKY